LVLADIIALIVEKAPHLIYKLTSPLFGWTVDDIHHYVFLYDIRHFLMFGFCVAILASIRFMAFVMKVDQKNKLHLN
jgi:hypothetical protein